MSQTLVAHCIHHTHWDPYWFFTSQESEVVFALNVQRMLQAFRRGEVDTFFLDGQTTAVDEYLQYHPEDKIEISQLIQEGRLQIGPFVSQLDPFICSAESIVNNLRLGILNAKKLGKCSMIAYLADPFGVSYSFPKIFNQFDIENFVFTRGIGDIYDVKNEFFLESNDKSKILCHVLLSGYGFGTYSFLAGTLFDGTARDYNLLNVMDLIKRLVSRSSLKNEFVFPVGFDQNPVALNLAEIIEKYNSAQKKIKFIETTWPEYFENIRRRGAGIKTLATELTSPQFHRLHLSGMNSARSDIKTIIDKAERALALEAQPLMTLLSSLGLKFDHGLIDQNWYDLVNCQTHASATHGDVTNEKMKQQASEVLSRTNAITNHLARITCLSLKSSNEYGSDLIVFNTLPWNTSKVAKLKVITKAPSFFIKSDNKILDSVCLSQERVYGGTLRLDPKLMSECLWFYRSEVVVDLGAFEGISYRSFQVVEDESLASEQTPSKNEKSCISNGEYEIEFDSTGITLHAHDGINLKRIITFEDMGDAGDSYDYSPPTDDKDWRIVNDLHDAKVKWLFQSDLYACMELEGILQLPKNQNERAERLVTVNSNYNLKIELYKGEPFVRVSGSFENESLDHRLRVVINTGDGNKHSHAGIPFGIIERPVENPEKPNWQSKGFFEEPANTRPLLNYVCSVNTSNMLGVLTGGLKEYEFIDDQYSKIALTLFRSVGFIGLPDLERRPGRASGVSNAIIPAQTHQMQGINRFSFALLTRKDLNPNDVDRCYSEYAVRQIYYQNQRLDTLLEPIYYFPVHPFLSKLPRKYCLLYLKSFAGAFSTLTVSKNSKRILLRVYNASDRKLPPYLLEGLPVNAIIEETNLAETRNFEASVKQGGFEPGELRTLAITLKRKGEL
jgi:mannosylglycerate hydrolase